MKILFSLTYYTPYVSGLTIHAKRLAEEFVKRGHQVSVISFKYEKELKTEETVNGVRILRIKPQVKVSKGFLSLDWWVKSLRESQMHDVVIVNLPQVEGFISAFIAKLLGKEVISIYHCEVVLPAGVINSIVNCFLNLVNIISLILSNRIVTYTKDFADNSKILRPFKYKLNYIYPPIIKPEMNKRVQDMIRKKIDECDFVIGVAARLAAEKGMEYLFEVMPQIKSKIQNPKSKNCKVKILIAGPMEPVGEEKYKVKIMNLVKKYQNQIVFLGTIKEENMGSFYSLIDVLVLPSVNSTEAFGMVQVEAMMYGVPVVATDLPGVRIPILRTGMGIIVPVKDSSSLGRAIAQVLSDRKKFIKNEETIQKEFQLGEVINSYNKLLETAKS